MYQEPNQEPNQDNRLKQVKEHGRQGFVSAALVCGILSLVLCFTIIVPIICGSLAIVFAFLSRGDRPMPERRARIGWITGATALIITAFLFIMGVQNIIRSFGSFDNYVSTVQELTEDYMETGELNMDELYNYLS